MAHYVMSDIHGELDRFCRMLEQIHFSDDDMLYVIGDVVDRGPDGIGLIRKIMSTPNMELLLGNHEHMMLRYFSPDVTEREIRGWNRNNNVPTIKGFQALPEEQQREVLGYLRTRATHLELRVNDQRFYLVHGFPGNTVRDEVWQRPDMQTENPVPDCVLIIGHTPICCIGRDEAEEQRYCDELATRGEHMRICHAPGFIDIDCGCGYDIPAKALACLRLEDMAEYYEIS